MSKFAVLALSQKLDSQILLERSFSYVFDNNKQSSTVENLNNSTVGTALVPYPHGILHIMLGGKKIKCP